ncbi:MAG: aspartate aminotransferase family protein, partial [Alphaproteobacteria bacterium]|nr:aspartate aminotransferase family protein [Alphaproteobacteria bacterium]
ELEPAAGAPGRRGYEALEKAFFDQSMVVRISGDTVVLIPALIAGDAELSRMTEGVRAVLNTL